MDMTNQTPRKRNIFMVSKFDEWLTNQPGMSPIHHNYEIVKEETDSVIASIDEENIQHYDAGIYSLAMDNYDGLRCYSCKEAIGFVLDDTGDVVSGYYSDFWQMDEDAEILLCDPCYESILERDSEIDY